MIRKFEKWRFSANEELRINCHAVPVMAGKEAVEFCSMVLMYCICTLIKEEGLTWHILTRTKMYISAVYYCVHLLSGRFWCGNHSIVPSGFGIITTILSTDVWFVRLSTIFKTIAKTHHIHRSKLCLQERFNQCFISIWNFISVID